MRSKSFAALGFAAVMSVSGLVLAQSARDSRAAPEQRGADKRVSGDRSADTQQRERPDAWITAKTKIALMTADDVRAMDINVDTIDGNVTLHGKVESEREKRSAETAARRVDGVRTVKNLLQIVPAERKEMVSESDDKIRERLEKAWDKDRQLDESGITLASVNNGVVLLEGRAKSVSDHLAAVRVARATPGVKRVVSEVKTDDELADASTWRDDMGERMTGAKGSAADARITSAAKLRLMANDKVPALQVNVDTNDGVVSLFGEVPSEEAKRAAERDVRKVSGVKQVRNNLEITPEKQRQISARKDEDIEEEVKNAFSNYKDFEKLDVDAKNGVVRLSGEVPSMWHRVRAATIARSQEGVKAVRDDLKTKKEEKKDDEG